MSACLHPPKPHRPRPLIKLTYALEFMIFVALLVCGFILMITFYQAIIYIPQVVDTSCFETGC